MLIFRYAKEGTLEIEGLKKIAATCDVTTEGVGGAKTFFEAKANEVRSAIRAVATLAPIVKEPALVLFLEVKNQLLL